MVTIFRQNNGSGLQQIQSYERNCWVHVTDPTTDEIDKLKKEFHVPSEFIEDILDIDERSRTEVEGRWLMVLIRVPVYLPKTEVSFYTVPLGILISQNLMITICDKENEIINDMVEGKVKNMNLFDKQRFVLNIFHSTASYYLRFMKVVVRRTNQIEKDIRGTIDNSQLNIMLKVQKCLVYFITSLKANEIVLEKLKRGRFVDSAMLDEDLMEDVSIETRQAVETAKIHSEIITSMVASFASIISNNLNVVMKRLTSITIILMVPTLITSTYGMNVPNFLESSPYAFAGIVSSSLLVAFMLILIFRKMRWF